jgi:hypothetical protein
MYSTPLFDAMHFFLSMPTPAESIMRNIRDEKSFRSASEPSDNSVFDPPGARDRLLAIALAIPAAPFYFIDRNC